MNHYCIIHASFQALFYQATRIKKPPEGGNIMKILGNGNWEF